MDTITGIPWSGRGHRYTEGEINAVVEALTLADPLTQGRYLKEFEDAFKAYLGVEHAFAVANCTNALELATTLCGITSADEVIIPAHTFCATAIPFARTGAKIVWADIDPDTWVVDSKTIAPLITSKTKAIVVVHLYGLPCRMDRIVAMANDHNIPVIEDCAQAITAELDGRKVGTFGDFACFSFHGAKNMTTGGEGGMLVVKDSRHAASVPGLRHNGIRSYIGQTDYWKPAMSDVDVDLDGVWPFNFCISEPACALGIQLLKRIDAITQDRSLRAAQFRDAFTSYPELVFQEIPRGVTHAHHLLPVRYDGKRWGKHRDDVIRVLFTDFNIKTIVQYCPLYRYPLFIKMGLGEAHCPHTDHLYDNMISFPFHHWLSDREFDYMIESTRQSLSRLRG